MYKVKVLRTDKKSYFIEVPDIKDLDCWVISNDGTWLSLEYTKELKKIVSKDDSFKVIKVE